MKVTLSVIKADIGGWVGHCGMHPELIAEGEACMAKARKSGLLIDYHVTRCGDDLQFIMTHKHGVDNYKVHELAWNAFQSCTKIAKKLKLHGAGQDLLSDAFSGNVKGQGPGVAEMEIDEREAEPVVVFMADKTASGAWNLPLYAMFCDPFNTIGLVISSNMHKGFLFEVHDVKESKKITFKCPEEMYDMLVLIGAPSRYTIKAVYSRETGEIGASSSTQKLSLLAGRYVGKDDPDMIVRAQKGLPDVGEVLEPFAMPFFVAGWNRGSPNGPFMPVSETDAHMSRFDGPPRVMALGFQLADGMLGPPADMFDDVGFDKARAECNDMANYIRRNGPFQPHRLEPSEMEYTTLNEIMKKLKLKFKKA
jgi:fructose 1,6-bisphosphate aldolase/phosphatase